MKFSTIVNYFSDVKLEFSKVVWLKYTNLSRLVIMVMVTTILTACFFAVIDTISQSFIMRLIFI